jgi:hypothetical protein
VSRTITVELREKGQQISLFESVGDRQRRRKARRARPLTEGRRLSRAEWARRLTGQPTVAAQVGRMRWVVRLLHGRKYA